MAKDFEFVLNRQGVAELLNSLEMKKVLGDHARATAEAAGTGYEVSVYTGKSRPNASVRAETSEARRDNYENNTLLKSLR